MPRRYIGNVTILVEAAGDGEYLGEVVARGRSGQNVHWPFESLFVVGSGSAAIDQAAQEAALLATVASGLSSEDRAAIEAELAAASNRAGELQVRRSRKNPSAPPSFYVEEDEEEEDDVSELDEHSRSYGRLNPR